MSLDPSAPWNSPDEEGSWIGGASASHPGPHATPQPPAIPGQPAQPPAYGQQQFAQPIQPAPFGASIQQGQPASWGYGQFTQPTVATGTITPGRGVSGAPRRRGRTAGIVAGLVGSAALLGGAGLAYVALSGGGDDQPDRLVPREAVAAVMVDFDPSAEQKLEAIKIARKLPRTKDLDFGSTDKDPRKFLYESAVGDSSTAPAWSEIEPWIGERFGAAVLPSPEVGSAPVPLVIAQVTDQDKARAVLNSQQVMGQSLGIAGEGGWVILAQTQAQADSAWKSAQESSLAESSEYRQVMDAAGEPGMLSAWMDLDQVDEMGSQLAALAGQKRFKAGDEPLGQLGMRLRFVDSMIELSTAERGGTPYPAAKPVSFDAPKDAIAVLSASGIDGRLKQSYAAVQEQALMFLGTVPGEPSDAKDPWSRLLGDAAQVEALAGSEATLVVGNVDSGSVQLTVKSSDPALDRALGNLKQGLAQESVSDFHIERTDAGYTASYGEPPVGTGMPGAPLFTSTVPEASQAIAVGFVDLGRLVELAGTDDEDAAALSALGFSAVQAQDGLDMRFRLAFR